MNHSRTPEEVLSHHAKALRSGDVEQVLKDFTDLSVLITLDRTYRGRNEIREFYTTLVTALPDAEWSAERVFEGNVLLVHWTAKSSGSKVTDGTDTFIFRDGMIAVQTVRATLEQ